MDKFATPIEPFIPIDPVKPIAPGPVYPFFQFQGIKVYCHGCAVFEPVDRPQRLGSGVVLHRIECKNADKCSAIKSHLEKQIGLPKK